MSPRFMSSVSFDMRNEQICKMINISRYSLLLRIVGDSDFVELEWRIQSDNPTSMELLTRNLDGRTFKLKLWKKNTWANKDFNYCVAKQVLIQAKCVSSLLLEVPFLKYNKNAVFLFKNTDNKEKRSFLFEKYSFLCLVVAVIF